MKKIYSLIIATLILSSNVWSQPIYEWADALQPVGTPTPNQTTGIVADTSGNVYVTGYFQGTIDFDPGVGTYNLTSVSGTNDIFLAKYSSIGALVWANAFGATSSQSAYCITIDLSSNIYIGGQHSGSTFDWDPGPGVYSPVGTGAGFVAKYDQNGNFVWLVQNGTITPESIDIDNSNNLFVSGSSGTNCGIWKYNLSGTTLGNMNIGSTGLRYTKITTDASGNVYMGAHFSTTNSGDLDPGAGVTNFANFSGTGYDIVLVKYSNILSFIWADQIGGTGSEMSGLPFGLSSPLDIEIDNQGNVCCSGACAAGCDFDPTAAVQTVPPGATADAFFAKYNSTTGNLIFVKQFTGGGAVTNLACNIEIDANDNINVGGNFFNIVDFDPGPGTANLGAGATGNHLFIAKYDINGNYLSAYKIGNLINKDVQLYRMFLTSSNMYLCGRFQDTHDFDMGIGTANLTTDPTNFTGFFAQYGYCSSSPAQPASITGSTSICSGTTNTYSITAVAGATSYTWALPGGWTGTSTTNSINATASSTSGNITVTANNTCGNSTAATLAVVVNTIPATPGTISGTATICSGTTNTYSITAVAGATSYTWALPGGWTGTSTTNSINATASATSGNITVTANNACGNSSVATLAITVNSIPATPGTISGLASMCVGTGAQTYSITAVGGATSYTWTLPATWSGTSTTNSIVATPGTSGGNITVTANNTCGNSSAQTLAVVINPLPTVTYSQSPALVCINATSVVLGTVSPTGGTFSGTAVTGSTFNATTAGTGTFNITYTYTDGNGCVNNDTSSIVVDPCTGVQSGVLNQELGVFPNPTNSIVTLTGIEKESTIEVFNVLGEKVISTQSKNTSVNLDLSEFENGIYFVNVSSEKETVTKRVIKN